MILNQYNLIKLLLIDVTVETARADAERIKKIGEAEAISIELIGKAEAERMKMRAAAFKHYGDAAVMAMVLESLPLIAAEVSAPLAKTDEIVMVGGNNSITNGVNRIMSEVPPAFEALTDAPKLANKPNSEDKHLTPPTSSTNLCLKRKNPFEVDFCILFIYN
ncbi:Flotillin-2 [Armadillidium vulgare]|nr:Flotillin-2 [Armadillidium vulgare]